MTLQENRLSEYLGKNGLKNTRERNEILVCISAIEGHFDPESLYFKLKAEGRKVSRASVYRSMPIMLNCGMIREAFRDRNGVKYEYSEGRSHHDHMECIKCGSVIEFVNEEIERLQEIVSRNYGFTLIEHHLKLRGICRQCSDSND